jgi:DHA3 family multidrug efflux protein-like MFS transporter
MVVFRRLLANALVGGVMSSFLWFALTFWTYLETRSVIATSVIGGAYAVVSAVFGMLFGTFVDRHRKHTAMVVASAAAAVCFALATTLYAVAPADDVHRLDAPWFWLLVALVLAGSVVGNLRSIALSTSVTLLVPEGERDRANGMIGATMGVSFTLTSVFSGLAIGQLGMGWALALSTGVSVLALAHLLTIRVPEDEPEAASGHEPIIDVRGAVDAIRRVPGLFGLIGFAACNNLLGGVFMSLMDAYGLELVSVEAWGILFAVLSLGFIVGGLAVSKRGLGSRPLRVALVCNLVNWAVCSVFTVRTSIVLLSVGMFVWLVLMPVIEAAEQTVLQKVVPFEQQGRVFGFAQTIENAASPITALAIGPVAQLWVIPFMTDGTGADSIGSWFGTGVDRGIALIFTVAGLVGILLTLIAAGSRWYRAISRAAAAPAAAQPVPA